MLKTKATDRSTRFVGAILGTAVGDALGLPRERLSRSRAKKIFGDRPLRHALIARLGMASDDTEHTCMTAQALLASRGDPRRFARSLAWRLRWWMLGFPAAVGRATAQAIIKLWLGFGPERSGVWSAGNGPAMRAAIIGVYASDNVNLLAQLVKASSRLTHTDPAAEHGALAIALATAFAARVESDQVTPERYLSFIGSPLAGTPILALLGTVARQVDAGQSFEEYLNDAGLARGISGYINHTVPAAIFCWLKWPLDFREAVEQIIVAGGDTDSTGAIVGELVGITAGPDSIPEDWLSSLIEWPRDVTWMKRLASTLGRDVGIEKDIARPVALFWPGLLVRNLFFLLIIFLHGIRRALPPY